MFETIIKASIFYFIFICSFACIDPIEFDIPRDLNDDLAIDAKLTFSNEPAIDVQLKQVFKFDGRASRVLSTRVELINDIDEIVALPEIEFNHFYLQFDDLNDFKIDINKSYKLRVYTTSGDIIESELQTFDQKEFSHNIKQIRGSKLIQGVDGVNRTIESIIFVDDIGVPAGEDIYLRWEVLETYKVSNFGVPFFRAESCGPSNIGDICSYLKQNLDFSIATSDCDQGGVSNLIECLMGTDPTNPGDDRPNGTNLSCYFSNFVNLTNSDVVSISKESNKSQASNVELFESSINFKYAEGYSVSIIFESVPREVGQYYRNLDQLINSTGSQFEPAKGRLVGNLTNTTNPNNEVYGVFYTSIQDTVGIYIEPDESFNKSPLCLGPLSADGFCLNCIAGSANADKTSLFPPDFWIE